jgi:hypothetical protein
VTAAKMERKERFLGRGHQLCRHRSGNSRGYIFGNNTCMAAAATLALLSGVVTDGFAGQRSKIAGGRSDGSTSSIVRWSAPLIWPEARVVDLFIGGSLSERCWVSRPGSVRSADRATYIHVAV